MFIIFKIPIITGMRSDEDLKFIEMTSVWRKGNSFHLEDCLFFNFGYDRELPYAKIDLSSQQHMNISIKTNGMESPSGCNVVLIAGKYVQHVDQVMKRMDDIAEQTQFVPLAAFIFDENANIDVSAR